MDTLSTITCPHCKKPIQLTQAIASNISQAVIEQERQRHQEEMKKLEGELSQKTAKELLTLKEEMEKNKAELVKSQEAELSLRKEKNKLDEDRRTFELEKQRQLDSEREKIRQKALAENEEKQRLVVREYELKIESMKKAVEEAQRKASQGSQQLQGEAQEVDLEESLRSTFRSDVIEPIGKGVLGADIRQIVKSPLGISCGTILWESKRTKAWSDGWIQKLKDDLLHDKAHIAAIITETLPEEAKSGIGLKDGVWVASFKMAIALASLLRKSLLDVAKQKKISENQQTKAESLYEYVTSVEFVQRMESMIDTYTEMKDQIQDERNAFERIWKKREMQVTRLLTGATGLYGSMQGIAGQALPTLKNTSLLPGAEGLENQ